MFISIALHIRIHILIHCYNAISILYWTEKRLKIEQDFYQLLLFQYFK